MRYPFLIRFDLGTVIYMYIYHLSKVVTMHEHDNSKSIVSSN